MSGPDAFTFLGQSALLSECGWDSPLQDKLWRYNLHYFDDLNAAGQGGRVGWHRELIARWIAENPPAKGTGWEPYPLSLRIVNWLKWSFQGHELEKLWLDSLAVQTRWLAGRLEWHLLGNHLFANAKALVYSGLVFDGKESDEWLAKGLRIIQSELPEQVLVDGGHFERSPMYHAIFLEDLLDLLNAAFACPGQIPDAVVESWKNTIGRMLVWQQAMLHPDGDISFFNDAAIGIAPTHAQLSSYAARLGVQVNDSLASIECHRRISHLADSGYIRMQDGAGVAILDVAPIGPDYLPGHAHADTLSFELSILGQRVIVNGGTSCYGTSPRRLRERQTCSHSTVEVDGESSSEVWSGFRVARRAYPFDLQVQEDSASLFVACSHDGYKRLPGQPIHRRRWRMDGVGFEVTDSVEGGHRCAVSRFIFHPAVHVREVAMSVYQLTFNAGVEVVLRVVKGRARLGTAEYSPEFGRSCATSCLVVELDGGCSGITLQWA